MLILLKNSKSDAIAQKISGVKRIQFRRLLLLMEVKTKVMIIQNKKVEETALKKRLKKLDKKLYSVWSGNDEEKSIKTQNSLELLNYLANANISLIVIRYVFITING